MNEVKVETITMNNYLCADCGEKFGSFTEAAGCKHWRKGGETFINGCAWTSYERTGFLSRFKPSEPDEFLSKIFVILNRELSTYIGVLGEGGDSRQIVGAVIWWEGASCLYENPLQLDAILVNGSLPEPWQPMVKERLHVEWERIKDDFLP